MLVLVLVVSFALVAWAAVYRYGRGTQTLAYDNSSYTCPVAGQTIRMLYQVDGNTMWDSYGSVLFYGTFRDYEGGAPHYHEYQHPFAVDFDSTYKTWNTGHRLMVTVAADPSGLSYYAPMVLAIYCQ
jgi:hypothetical protein